MKTENKKNHERKLWKFGSAALAVSATTAICAITASAVGLAVPAQVSEIITFFVGLLKIVGGVVGLIGAVMFFMAVKDQDAHGKQTGMLTFVSGAGVFAVATAFGSGAIFG